MELKPITIEIVSAVLIVIFAVYVLFCLGVFSRDK